MKKKNRRSNRKKNAIKDLGEQLTTSCIIDNVKPPVGTDETQPKVDILVNKSLEMNGEPIRKIAKV